MYWSGDTGTFLQEGIFAGRCPTSSKVLAKSCACVCAVPIYTSYLKAGVDRTVKILNYALFIAKIKRKL